jgi:hypothetical protein
MPTEMVVLEAELHWCKVFEHNRDMDGYEGAAREFDGEYSVTAKLDEENLEKLEASKSMKAANARDKGPDENGLFTVKFTRKHMDRFEWASGAPKVTTDTDEPWDGTTLIGNGSKGLVTVAVYSTRRPSIFGTRLEKVQVTDLEVLPGVDTVDDEIPF